MQWAALRGVLIVSCPEMEFINHMDGKKKEIRDGESHEAESVSQNSIKMVAVKVKIIGPIFIDDGIKGERDNGLKSHVIAEPAMIAPSLRFRVGRIK